MLIGIDGACMKNGTPECISCGIAFCMGEDDSIQYFAHVEKQSTSQRGELNGLIQALEYALKEYSAGDLPFVTAEDACVIITDSEYLYNSVMKEWCFKWRDNNWLGASGERVANTDLWEHICQLLQQMSMFTDVVMQWTKGHLISGLTPSVIKRLLTQDETGVSVYTNVCSIAMRSCEHARIAKDFNKYREQHQQIQVPEDTAVDWAIMNVVADYLAAAKIKSIKDELAKKAKEELHDGN